MIRLFTRPSTGPRAPDDVPPTNTTNATSTYLLWRQRQALSDTPMSFTEYAGIDLDDC